MTSRDHLLSAASEAAIAVHYKCDVFWVRTQLQARGEESSCRLPHPVKAVGKKAMCFRRSTTGGRLIAAHPVALHSHITQTLVLVQMCIDLDLTQEFEQFKKDARKHVPFANIAQALPRVL